MHDLNDDLSHFARAIVRGEEPSPQINTGYSAYTLDVSIEVYRNNYRGNLHDALAGVYPVIKQLVGDDFFRMMALKFIEQYPSRSANLHHYGAELSYFAAQFEPAKELVYLSDVAALEWACHIAYFVKDEAIFDLNSLAQIPPEQYSDLIFHLHPAVSIVHSLYPINDIWQAHQSGANSDFYVDLDSGKSIVLVSRKADVVLVVELSEDEAMWLQLIQAGNPLGYSTSTTVEQYPVFDLQATLLKLVAQNVLVDVC